MKTEITRQNKLTVWGTPISRIDIFLPSFSEIHPYTKVKPIVPNAVSDEIHDSSSLVIFPELKGVSFDLNSSRFGPLKPITTPKMKAVKFTAKIKHKKL